MKVQSLSPTIMHEGRRVKASINKDGPQDPPRRPPRPSKRPPRPPDGPQPHLKKGSAEWAVASRIRRSCPLQQACKVLTPDGVTYPPPTPSQLSARSHHAKKCRPQRGLSQNARFTSPPEFHVGHRSATGRPQASHRSATGRPQVGHRSATS